MRFIHPDGRELEAAASLESSDSGEVPDDDIGTDRYGNQTVNIGCGIYV